MKCLSAILRSVQTLISPEFASDPRVGEIDSILRKCVHCGMCLATCPTYQLLGDELDSPRGRIYQIKQVVEGHAPTADTLRHLDRCLTCRNCETPCPSGVNYGHLVDQGRALVEERVSRGLTDRIKRRLLLTVLPYPSRIGRMVRLGQWVRPLLPAGLKRRVTAVAPPGVWPSPRHERRLLVLGGCVQPSLTPATNSAAARVLDACGVSLIRVRNADCCGAVPFHLNQHDDAKVHMRRNIDAWWPEINNGAYGILVTASGCGVMLKDYGHVLADDPDYAQKAARISELAMDTVQAVQQALSRVDDTRMRAVQRAAAAIGPVAFHPPCTLQHGQRLAGVTEGLLRRMGFGLTRVADSHLCCGSAGTYSLFQPELALQLRENKVSALQAERPAVIATANIGCQVHIAQGVESDNTSGKLTPVVHWIELVDRALAQAPATQSNNS